MQRRLKACPIALGQAYNMGNVYTAIIAGEREVVKVFTDIFSTDKKYQIIYADPPWSYKDKALAGKRGACCKYPTMEIKDISKLPISDVSDKDCVLFLWVTMPKLDECFDLIKAWGFTYKTCAFTWCKRNKNSLSWFMGMGRWTRANAEICLLATKGNPKRISAKVRSIIDTPIENHSKKPDEVRTELLNCLGIFPE